MNRVSVETIREWDALLAEAAAEREPLQFALVLATDPARRALDYYLQRAADIPDADLNTTFLAALRAAGRKAGRGEVDADAPWPIVRAILARSAQKATRQGWNADHPRKPGSAPATERERLVVEYDVSGCIGARLESAAEEMSWTLPLARVVAQIEAKLTPVAVAVFHTVVAFMEEHRTRYGAFTALSGYARLVGSRIAEFDPSAPPVPPTAKAAKAVGRQYREAEATVVRILEANGIDVPATFTTKAVKKSKGKRAHRR